MMKRVKINYSELNKKEKVFFWLRQVFLLVLFALFGFCVICILFVFNTDYSEDDSDTIVLPAVESSKASLNSSGGSASLASYPDIDAGTLYVVPSGASYDSFDEAASSAGSSYTSAGFYSYYDTTVDSYYLVFTGMSSIYDAGGNVSFSNTINDSYFMYINVSYNGTTYTNYYNYFDYSDYFSYQFLDYRDSSVTDDYYCQLLILIDSDLPIVYDNTTSTLSALYSSTVATIDSVVITLTDLSTVESGYYVYAISPEEYLSGITVYDSRAGTAEDYFSGKVNYSAFKGFSDLLGYATVYNGCLFELNHTYCGFCSFGISSGAITTKDFFSNSGWVLGSDASSFRDYYLMIKVTSPYGTITHYINDDFNIDSPLEYGYLVVYPASSTTYGYYSDSSGNLEYASLHDLAFGNIDGVSISTFYLGVITYDYQDVASSSFSSTVAITVDASSQTYSSFDTVANKADYTLTSSDSTYDSDSGTMYIYYDIDSELGSNYVFEPVIQISNYWWSYPYSEYCGVAVASVTTVYGTRSYSSIYDISYLSVEYNSDTSQLVISIDTDNSQGVLYYFNSDESTFYPSASASLTHILSGSVTFASGYTFSGMALSGLDICLSASEKVVDLETGFYSAFFAFAVNTPAQTYGYADFETAWGDADWQVNVYSLDYPDCFSYDFESGLLTLTYNITKTIYENYEFSFITDIVDVDGGAFLEIDIGGKQFYSNDISAASLAKSIDDTGQYILQLYITNDIVFSDSSVTLEDIILDYSLASVLVGGYLGAYDSGGGDYDDDSGGGSTDNSDYQQGYLDGYNDGINASWSSPITTILSAVGDIFDINLFGNFSLGTFVMIGVYLFLCIAFIRLFAGG